MEEAECIGLEMGEATWLTRRKCEDGKIRYQAVQRC